MIIEESGMRFKVDDARSFYIEKSNFYINFQEGLKIVEFISLDEVNETCELIEAKQSSPKPDKGNVEKGEKFNVFINDINEKFVNGFNLYMANRLGRHRQGNLKEMPEILQTTDTSSLKFKFVLVINGHKLDWLSPISDKLKIKMHPFIKAWNIKDQHIKIMNDTIARETGYIE